MRAPTSREAECRSWEQYLEELVVPVRFRPWLVKLNSAMLSNSNLGLFSRLYLMQVPCDVFLETYDGVMLRVPDRLGAVEPTGLHHCARHLSCS